MKTNLLLLFTLFSSFSYAANLDIQSLVKKYDLPALAGAKIQTGKPDLVIASGHRKYGDSTKVTTKDKFHLGSNTKSMTATLLAIYIEKGKLKWTTKLSEIFTDISLHELYKEVTIEMILAHRSGITGDFTKIDNGKLWSSLWNEKLNPVEGRKNVVQRVLSQKPDVIPGSKYIYSNAGYTILGAILEKITQKSWEELMQKELFNALGMNSCGFGAPGVASLDKPDQPWMHTSKKGKPSPLKPGFFADNPPTIGPSGSVHCSLADWGKYLSEHIKGFKNQSNFLKNKTFKKLHTQYPGQDYTYGGWIRLERNWAKGAVLHHSGSNTLSRSVVWLAPNLSTALLSATNYGSKEAYQGMDEVIAFLLPPSHR